MRGKRKAVEKARRCRSCGSRKMRQIDAWVCEDCMETGAGRNAMEGRYITDADAMEVLTAMRERERLGMSILDGLSDLAISAVARLYRGTPWYSYGRMRSYCDSTGKVPPMEGLHG